MHIFENIDQLIGNTPLLSLSCLNADNKHHATIVAKLECQNPAGSVKDRAAKFMLDAAEREGLLTNDTVLIEPTSGNTGIGLAALCAARGYRLILTMPETMSIERRNLLAAYGAELVLTEGSKGMRGAIEKAEELAASMDNSLIPGQFINPANPAAHFATTGPELWRDTDGTVDVFVAGIGTGGTISGVGNYLKSQNSAIEIVGVEPSDSPVLNGGKPGPHKLQGIGAGFVPKNLDTTVYDQVVPITKEEAFEMTNLVAKRTGILVGISSGAAIAAANKLAQTGNYDGKTIVVLLPDRGERYLSTGVFTSIDA